MSMCRTFHLAVCVWAVASCLLLPTVATGQNPQTADSETLLLKAQDSFQAGRYEQARKRFQRVLDLDPNNRAAFKGLVQTDREIERTPGQEQTTGESTGVHSKEEMQKKLNSIVLPQVIFDHARLADAVEYLRRESVRLDPNPDPNQRGVKITVRYPAAIAGPIERSSIPGLPGYGSDPLPTPNPLAPDLAITLTSSPTIPLLDVLYWMAQLANLSVRTSSEGVCFISPDDLQTKDFQVPSGFIPTKPKQPADANTNAGNAKGEIPNEEMTDYLKSCGVQFPQGTGVQYLPATQKLIVCNTEENIDLIEALVAEFKQTVIPSAPNP